MTQTHVRVDGRRPDELREVRFSRGWLAHAEGSVLVEFGGTRVLCAASFVEGVPRWRRGSGHGWVTAEYAMLPRATTTRTDRESVRGRIGGRTHEISRLIGRSLRAVVDVAALGENTILLDCDVLQADGGTRTAAITGAYVALADAVAWGRATGAIPAPGVVLRDSVAAVSVGIVGGRPVLDLPYEEDVTAETDMNVVVTGTGGFVEVQGTAEGAPFDRGELDALLDLAVVGTTRLADLQRDALADGLQLPPVPGGTAVTPGSTAVTPGSTAAAPGATAAAPGGPAAAARGATAPGATTPGATAPGRGGSPAGRG